MTVFYVWNRDAFLIGRFPLECWILLQLTVANAWSDQKKKGENFQLIMEQSVGPFPEVTVEKASAYSGPS